MKEQKVQNQNIIQDVYVLNTDGNGMTVVDFLNLVECKKALGADVARLPIDERIAAMQIAHDRTRSMYALIRMTDASRLVQGKKGEKIEAGLSALEAQIAQLTYIRDNPPKQSNTTSTTVSLPGLTDAQNKKMAIILSHFNISKSTDGKYHLKRGEAGRVFYALSSFIAHREPNITRLFVSPAGVEYTAEKAGKALSRFKNALDKNWIDRTL